MGRGLFWIIASTGAAAFAAGVALAKLMFQSHARASSRRVSGVTPTANQTGSQRRRCVHMTPSVFQTLTHADCLRFLADAGIPQQLLDAVPDVVDGAIMMECATPDKFSFSTADKLFWVQIENGEACKRIAAVLDEMVAEHPHDIVPDEASPQPSTAAAAAGAVTTSSQEYHAPDSGYTVTSNRQGMMSNTPTPIMLAWIQRATQHPEHPMMDIGCAYGVATLEVLSHGATVIAIDPDSNHLTSLRTAAHNRNIPDARLRCIEGAVPEALAELRNSSVSHVLASNVFHFLSPTALTQTLRSLHRRMAPGSFLHIQMDSPYMRGLGIVYYIYQLRKLLGHHFPGYLPVPDFLQHAVFPHYIRAHRYQIIDADDLQRAVERAGFHVVSSGYQPLDDKEDLFGLVLDGRESTVIVAKR